MSALNAQNTTWRRPSLVTFERRVAGTPSATGEPDMTVTTVAESVLCRIVALNLFGSGAFSEAIEGKLFTATHLLVIDGLAPQSFAPAGPGESVVVRGVTYVVSPNGRGAFVPVMQGDRVFDLGGNFFGDQTHFVLGVDVYYEIWPNLQARVMRGEASGW